MLFNSAQFLLFLPVVMIGYFVCPQRFRWLFLLISSYYFYMSWRVEYVALIAASTLIDFYIVRAISLSPDGANKKRLLWLSIVMNMGILFFFKYFNFFADTTNLILEKAGMGYAIPFFDVLLPVGISFYTFQTMSYTIDVYRGHTHPERHLGIFALFVSFWPQLVAGPIERSAHLLPQFRKVIRFDYDRAVHGLSRIGYGFFKKVVVADRLAVYVNEVYSHPGDFSTLPLVIASVFFAFQIYCDFSGYTDIALGCAAIMGISLMENFDRPYLSRSIGEFWHRWHISLSTWFRDYVYIPLGGNRGIKWRMYYNLFITFLVSGLWHGANWTFVLWGGMHGIWLIWEKLTKEKREKLLHRLKIANFPRLVRINDVLLTFTLVTLGWIFFRAASVTDAFLILKRVASLDLRIDPNALMAFQGPYNFLVSIMVIGLLLGSYMLPRDMKIRHNLLFLLAIAMLVLLFGKGGESEFIYFQF